MWGKCLGSLISGVLLMGTTAAGSIVFSDAFDYPDGDLVRVSGGKWKTHSGTTGQLQVLGGAIQLSQRRSEDVHAPFPGGVIGPFEALELYVSFTANFSSLPTGVSGSYFAHFKDTTATTGIRCRVFATTNGAAAGTFRLGIASGTNSATSAFTKELYAHTTYRVVCRLNLGNNVSRLWLDPRAETDASLTSTDEPVPKNVAAIAFRQSLASGSGMGELTVDDVVVATTFLEVLPARAPVVLANLADQTVLAGGDVIFRVQAEGTAPLLYRWYFNRTELPGVTEASLVLRDVTPENSGQYYVTVRNRAGVVTSAIATLRVGPKPPRLAISRLRPEKPQLSVTWAALPGQSYSVWAGELLGEGFSKLSADLFFADGLGVFEATLSDSAMRFFQIRSP